MYNFQLVNDYIKCDVFPFPNLDDTIVLVGRVVSPSWFFGIPHARSNYGVFDMCLSYVEVG